MERLRRSFQFPGERYLLDVNARPARSLRNRNTVIRSNTGCVCASASEVSRGAAGHGRLDRLPAVVWHNSGMRPHLRGRSRLALLLVLSVVASGCGSAGIPTAPSSHSPLPPATATATATASVPATVSASTGQSDQATFAAIESQVQAIRELQPSAPVTPVLLDPTELRDKLTSINAAQTDHRAMANESRLYVDLGLLPAGSSLEQMELDLDSSQVIGFYDTDSKGLYVLSDSGGVGPIEKATFSHEYTHALQDQNFGLDKLATDAADQGDRDLARTAVPEGDATLVMTEWEKQNLSIPEMLAIAIDPSAAAQAQQFDAAPAILRQTLLFPYEDGVAFVQGIYGKGGWAAVNKLYADPPNSTSQILHPELYAAGIEPVAVAVPAVPAALASGWKLTMQDTLGELQLRIWLEGESPTNAATTAATSATSEWGGDRVGLYEGPGGAWAVALKTAWRTTAGGAGFLAAASSKAGTMSGPTAVCADGSGVAFYAASDRATLAAFATC